MPSALPAQISKWISRHCVYHEMCASAMVEIDQDLTPSGEIGSGEGDFPADGPSVQGSASDEAPEREL
eukprot:7997683-Pyramimonas_sp.AAC.1